LDIEEKILGLLQSVPLDKYSIHKMIPTKSIFTISEAINNLQQRGKIHVVKYRKETRTGIPVPLYSVYSCSERELELNAGGILECLTSERYPEFKFVLRNLVSRNTEEEAKILDVGCSTSALSSMITKFSGNRWLIISIDIANEIGNHGFPLIQMDARRIGFKDKTFDQVMCLSSMEHIGIADEGAKTKNKDLNCGMEGDALAMTEIWRVLKVKGTLILTVPYGRILIKQQGYRVYSKDSLSILTNKYSIIIKEFFGLKKGKWTKCSELEANSLTLLERSNQKFHSDIIACLLLKKE
jgi:SAM-dependent methyltransferase